MCASYFLFLFSFSSRWLHITLLAYSHWLNANTIPTQIHVFCVVWFLFFSFHSSRRRIWLKIQFAYATLKLNKFKAYWLLFRSFGISNMHECVRWRSTLCVLTSHWWTFDTRTTGGARSAFSKCDVMVFAYPWRIQNRDRLMLNHGFSWIPLIEQYYRWVCVCVLCAQNTSHLNGRVLCTVYDAQFWHLPKYIEYKFFRSTTCKLANLWWSKRIHMCDCVFVCLCGRRLKMIWFIASSPQSHSPYSQLSWITFNDYTHQIGKWKRNSAKSTRRA